MSKVYNRIESITGNVITVRAKDVQYKELAEIKESINNLSRDVDYLIEIIEKKE